MSPPINNLGSIEMKGFVNIIKVTAFPDVNARKKELNPHANPRRNPALGPNTIPPTITVIWIMVISKINKGKFPKNGTKLCKIIMAINIALNTI